MSGPVTLVNSAGIESRGWRGDDSGAGAIITEAGSIWAYGTWPENYYADFSGIVTAQTAATVLTLTNLSSFDGFSFSVYVMTGTTPALKIYPSYDGTNFEVTPLALVDLSATALNTAIAGSVGATVVGNYIIPNDSKYRSLRFDYTASVAGNCSVRGGIWKK